MTAVIISVDRTYVLMYAMSNCMSEESSWEDWNKLNEPEKKLKREKTSEFMEYLSQQHRQANEKSYL